MTDQSRTSYSSCGGPASYVTCTRPCYRSPPATVPKRESAATPKQRWRQQLHLETVRRDSSQLGAMNLISPSSAMTGVTDCSPNSVVTAEDEVAVAWPATPSTAQVRHNISTSMVINPRPLCSNHMCIDIDNDHDDDSISPRSTLSIDLNVGMPGAAEPARASLEDEDYNMTPVSDSGRSSDFLENRNTSSTNMVDTSMATKTSNQVRNVGVKVPRPNKKSRQKISSFDSTHNDPKIQSDFHSSSNAEVSSRDPAQVSQTQSEDASGEDFAAACALLQLASDGERRRKHKASSTLVRPLPLERHAPNSRRESGDADDSWLLVDSSTSVLPRPGYKQRYKSVAALLAETPRLEALRVDQD